MAKKRVVIVVNKWWEADPVTSVLLHDKARPASITGVKARRYPTQRARKPTGEAPPDPVAKPRLTFKCAGANVELWCAEELMNPAANPSSTAEKARVLPRIFEAGDEAAAFVAVGTAAAGVPGTLNGSVVVGNRVFIHDPVSNAADRTGMWSPPHPDQVVDSPGGEKLLRAVPDDTRFPAEGRFLRPPIDAGEPMRLLFGTAYVSVGVVNITNYADYIWADPEAEEAFRASGAAGHVGCVETTHGVIREQCEAPFLYVSGITDGPGRFDLDVAPRVYAQNTACAHNAGVALAWLLPAIVDAL